jgi:coproporphyrinogen III oxidase-like Fe-S oxidoreductase
MVQILQSEGLLEVQNDHIRLTRIGKPLVDSVAVALLGDGG